MINKNNKINIFNSPLEAGTRTLILLTEAYPLSLDMQKIIHYEYLMVHSGDIDGPESLHPPTPLRAGELLVRRRLIETGIELMMSKGLLTRVTKKTGIEFSATETSHSFVSELQSSYSLKLKNRAKWVVASYHSLSDSEFSKLMKIHFGRWIPEFHSVVQFAGEI